VNIDLAIDMVDQGQPSIFFF